MAIARTVDRRLFFVLDRTFLQIAGTGRRNAAISGLVDRMEAADLIFRKQSYGDRRQRTVQLTDKGWAIREAVMTDFRDFNTQLTKGLTEAEREAVMKFLSQSVKNVSKK